MPTSTETLQALAADATTTRDRAIVRARFVQKEISILRERLGEGRGGEQSAALLASYDRELTRLCQIPGVLAALLAEMAIVEPTE